MESKSSEEISLLSILSENYEALYYVDFDLGTITPYRMNKVIEEQFGDYFRTNPSFEDAMIGYINAVVAPEDREEMLKRANPDFLREKLKGKRTYSYDYRINREDKQLYYRFKISKLQVGDELHQAAVGFADSTSEMERINQLVESQAMLELLEKDELTGLYNKEFFFKKVQEYLEDHPDTEVMLWTSDVQGLKVINEKYGMDVGDEILRVMGKSGYSQPGYLFGGRIEGDKLSALVLDDHPDMERLNAIMDHCVSQAPFPVPNVVIKNGLYHIKDHDTLSIQGMYDRTLLALQNIKNNFECNVAEYDDKLRKNLLQNRQILECARDALHEKQFKVYYQPKIDIAKGKIGGAEALVRWIHPEFGFMNPGVFIPLFEQNGFISNLDFYIWEEVCKALVDWREKGIPIVPVSVNVSRRDFEDRMLADKIIKLVDRYNLEHEWFQIEITESSYSDNPDVIKDTIKKLHDNGFSIALDDFGTGYSSMMALSSLDLDVMKLDMSIIQNDVPGTDKNVLEFSMQLADMMHLQTVAEGVETDAQADRIKSLGGNYIQGYFYSKPLDQAAYEKYVIGAFDN